MSRHRGNILFLILLAVVLFAALAYAVTSSMRGGGKDAGNEKASTQASSLLNYFTEMSSAVQRMMLTGNVKDYELNFYYQKVSNFIYGGNDNSNCTESRCRVFDPAGGSVTGRDLSPFVRSPSTSVADTVNTGRIIYVNIPGVGTSAPDVVMFVGGVTEKICNDINARFGYNGPIYNSTYPSNGSTIMYQFAIPTGPIPDTGMNFTGLPPEAISAGTFCTCRATTNWANCISNVNYPTIAHILVAR